jgi:hypothetical protein
MELMDALVPAGAAVLALVVGFGYKWLKGYVAKTETKIDDQILAAVKKRLQCLEAR